MKDCLFCKIISGDIPSAKLIETEDLVAFKDINPQAPTNILIVPKQHIDRIENLPANSELIIGKMVLTAQKLAKKLNLENGYRLVFNNGKDGGQEVEHIHLHLLGGRAMKWPPG